jgi:hypothetical protein
VPVNVPLVHSDSPYGRTKSFAWDSESEFSDLLNQGACSLGALITVIAGYFCMDNPWPHLAFARCRHMHIVTPSKAFFPTSLILGTHMCTRAPPEMSTSDSAHPLSEISYQNDQRNSLRKIRTDYHTTMELATLHHVCVATLLTCLTSHPCRPQPRFLTPFPSLS